MLAMAHAESAGEFKRIERAADCAAFQRPVDKRWPESGRQIERQVAKDIKFAGPGKQYVIWQCIRGQQFIRRRHPHGWFAEMRLSVDDHEALDRIPAQSVG